MLQRGGICACRSFDLSSQYRGAACHMPLDDYRTRVTEAYALNLWIHNCMAPHGVDIPVSPRDAVIPMNQNQYGRWLFNGWFAARAFESPAQRAANARSPSAGPIFASVHLGALDDQINSLGKVTYAHEASLTPRAFPAGAVVTRDLHKVGDTISSGSVVTEFNGPSAFVFPGRFAFYRDLRPGLEGPDVRQLQLGLKAAGLGGAARANGRYGPATAKAVQSLYQRDGYQPSSALPLSGLVVRAALSAMLESVLSVGTLATSSVSVATLGTGARVVALPVSSGAFVRLRVGMPATVQVTGAAQRLPARISALIAQAPGQSTDLSRAVLSTADSLPASYTGRQALGVVTIDVVAGRSLLVPSRAVATDTYGHSHVIAKATVSAAARVLRVHVTGTLGGISAIGVLGPGGLSDKSLVQVG